MTNPKRIPPWLWLLAIALLAFTGYLFIRTELVFNQIAVIERQSVDAQRRGKALDAERERYQQALAIVKATGTTRLELKPTSSAAPSIAAYWNASMGLVLLGDGLPVTPPGRTLQLWLVAKSSARGGSADASAASIGIVRPTDDGQLLMVMPPPAAANAQTLEITEETAGGNAKPSTVQWSAPFR